jgi:hypothetical protein
VFDDNGSFLLALFEFFLFVAWGMCLFWVFGDLFRSRDVGGVGKTLWTVCLLFLPILGLLVYLLVRGDGMQDRLLEAQAASRQRHEAGAAAEIASAKALLDSGAISGSEYERLKFTALSKTA